MNIEKNRLKRAQQFLFEVLDQTFEVKQVHAEQGDFGSLAGIQFDAEICGGFVYFWSSGMVEYHLVDYSMDTEVIQLSLVEVKDEDEIDKILTMLLEAIKGRLSRGQ